MADSLELDSLFRSSNRISEPQYEKVEWIQLYDQQGGVYDGGNVSFITDAQSKAHIVYSDSYLALPLRVTSTRVTATGTTRVAIKNSLVSLIQGLSVESGSGTQLVGEEMGLPIVQNLKLLIDSSTEFIDGNELMFFGKDQYIRPSVAEDGLSLVGGVDSKATSGLAQNDPKFNPALASRISVFQSRANLRVDGVAVGPATPWIQEFIAYIPLKFIHDFFAQMNFPMTNLSLKITFNIAGAGGYTGYSPFSTPAIGARLTLGDAVNVAPIGIGADIVGAAPTKAELVAILARTALPAMTPSARPIVEIRATVQDKAGFTTGPRLYLKQVYFQAAEALALAKNIAAGYKKSVTYTANNYYRSVQLSSSVDHPVVQGVIRPVRMWVMPVLAGTLASSDNTFPASTGPYTLTNFNIGINGNNFYNQEFKSQYQFYNELKTQLIGASTSTACGTPISYTDFLNGCTPYVFDLSRNPTIKSNNQCAVTVKADVKVASTGVAVAVPFDLIVCIERLMTATFTVSEGGVSVMAKQGSDL